MQEYEKDKLEYDRCMQDALGHSWDFSLLDNAVRNPEKIRGDCWVRYAVEWNECVNNVFFTQKEAEQECGAFFSSYCYMANFGCDHVWVNECIVICSIEPAHGT